MLLYLFILAVEPGNSVEIPPATDPTGRLIAVALATLAVLGPYFNSKVSAKKGVSNGPTPLNGASPTPRLDVSQQYLETYVKSLLDRAQAAEAEARDVKKQVMTLIEDRATFRAENKALREDIAELRGEVLELRGQLRGRGDGHI